MIGMIEWSFIVKAPKSEFRIYIVDEIEMWSGYRDVGSGEIFENDIIEANNGTYHIKGVVKWCKENNTYEADGIPLSYLFDYNYEVRIVGYNRPKRS